MKTELWLVTYNGMVGHPDLAVAGDLLFGQPVPPFGGAIEGFELYAHDHHGPPLPNLDSMLARYRERLATLPRVWFRRKRRLIEAAYHSRLGAARELLEREPKAAEVSTIRTACGEIADVLGGMIPRSVKRSDDFDTRAFVAFLGSRRSAMESASEGEILAMLKRERGPVGGAASGGSRAGDVAVGGPAIVAIDHADYHARHVGRTADGRQFF